MIRNLKEKKPKVHEDSFVADSAEIIGDVTICEGASVWFGAVLRGDCNSIFIGKDSNIQDNCTIHAEPNGTSVIIGKGVTIGHNVVLHGCRVGDNSMIGMGSVILDGTEIGEETIIGAGSLVTLNKKIPSGVLCIGSPAKVIRELTEEEKISIRNNAKDYVEEGKLYKK